jgi:hypothetical protein
MEYGRFYFDVHVPRVVALQLSARGLDILTAQADNACTPPDHLLLECASHLDRIIVNSDIRFRALAENWQRQQIPFNGMVFAHPLHVTIGQMVRDLELIAGAIPGEEIQNQIIFLPL